MQLTAKLIQILPLQSGTGKNGEWKKQDLIVETQEQYPKKICISVWGDKAQGVDLKEGAVYTIDFDIESREFNGKWYTDVKAWKLTPQSSAEAAQVPAPNRSASGITEKGPFDDDDEDDDLPF